MIFLKGTLMYGNYMHDMKDPQYSLKIMANNNLFFFALSIFIFYDNPSKKLLNDLSKRAGDFGKAPRKVVVAIFSPEELENNCSVLGQITTRQADPRPALPSQKKNIVLSK